ncbi:MAG: gamma-glutamylcyclotransferase [Rhodospirillales bacterium]
MEIPEGDIWVFGYGSLMWRPNFSHTEAQPALLRGYHRALCIYSIEYRGTRERPGLVLGLDRGGSCRGRAMKVAREHADEVIGYLHEREMINRVYKPKWLPVTLPSGKVSAYAFVADRSHEQYTGKLADDDAVRLILQGRGKGGPCLDYLNSTLRHLDELGIPDGPLHRLVSLANEAKEIGGAPGGRKSPSSP